MKAILITRDLADIAHQKACEIPADIKNSITGGKRRFIGCLGEAATASYLKLAGHVVEYSSSYDYDLIVNGKRLEVKTKRCKSKPLPSYECSVNKFNHTQACDYYVFTRVTNEAVYLLGYISPAELKQKARLMKAGDTDTNICDGKPFQFQADCYNIAISDLHEFK